MGGRGALLFQTGGEQNSGWGSLLHRMLDFFFFLYLSQGMVQNAVHCVEMIKANEAPTMETASTGFTKQVLDKLPYLYQEPDFITAEKGKEEVSSFFWGEGELWVFFPRDPEIAGLNPPLLGPVTREPKNG